MEGNEIDDIGLSIVNPVNLRTQEQLLGVFQAPSSEVINNQGVVALMSAIEELDPATARVAIYEVGQGSAHALVDADNVPILYFDLGGGCFWNAKTYPVGNRRTFCWKNQSIVVLSHFDFDHLYSGELDPRSWKSTWLTPSGQKFGPRVGKLLANIRKSGGKVRFWTGSAGVTVGPVSFARPTPGEKSKNNSGIVCRVELTDLDNEPWPVLMPADAGYSYIKRGAPVLLQGLQALVAAHHGSGKYTAAPPVGTGVLAYSAGKNNSYHHPSSTARTNHHKAGWTKALETQTGSSTGNIVFAPAPVLLNNIGCGCIPPCDLAPQQQ